MLFLGAADPLEGIFGSLHNLVPLLIGGAIWVVATWKKLSQKKAAGQPAPADEAGRTRRVQEEIRRKIAARRGEVPALDPFGGPGGYRRPERNFDPPARTEPIPPTAEEQAVLARQERLAAQARAIELAAADAESRPARPLAVTDAPAIPVSPWLAELRDPGSFRRAVVLREVLGAPVALR